MTAAQATEIVRLYERGMKVKDIATWCRCSEPTVFKVLRRKHVEPRRVKLAKRWRSLAGDPERIIRELRAAQ